MAKLLEIKDLRTYFHVDEGTVKAVDGVSISIDRQQTVGIVGESGCGKTITAQSILQIMPHPGRIEGGQILYYPDPDGEPVDLAALSPRGRKLRAMRGNEIAFIFQEPMSALSPIHTIGNQIMEALMIHNDGMSQSEARQKALAMLESVGMPNPEQRIDEYTFQLSGGMRQRAMIAMSLACSPKLLIADEPTTAIDVTLQAQILELLKRLKDEQGMSVLIITHDLAVVAEMADEVVVMYLGKVVERGSVKDVYKNPSHPYTRALLDSIPRVGQERRKFLTAIKGTVPDPYSIPKGCEFQPRCEHAMEGLCEVRKPEYAEISPGHIARCFLYTHNESEVG